MSTRRKKALNFRGFVSLYVAVSFIIMAITGIMLYISPPGRVAHWSNWTLLWLTKTQWQAIHTVFSLLFVGMAGIHLYFNWKPILTYFRTKAQTHIRLRREFMLAAGVTVFIGSFTLLELPPFQSIMDLGEKVSYSWATEETEPPVPHAELMTIKEFATTMQISPAEIRIQLESQGIQIIDPGITLQEIAKNNDISPQELYSLMELRDEVSSPIVEGGGYGRMTVEEIAGKLNVSTETALEKLQMNGIDARANSNIRQLGTQYNMLPYDLVELIQG